MLYLEISILKSIMTFKKILICIVGGPGSGKTTLLNNVLNILEEEYRYDSDNILVWSPRLLDSPDIKDKSVENIMKSDKMIVLDNHFIDDQLIEKIINCSKIYGYKTIIIHPWVNYSVLQERLLKRKNETGRIFDLDYYWKKHISFSCILHSYITEECPFDICIVYDNNNDDTKNLLYAKVMSKTHLINKEFLNEIEKQSNTIKDITNVNIENDHRTTKFIPRSEYFTSQLYLIFKSLFDDLSQLGSHKLLDYIDKICMEKTLIITNIFYLLNFIYKINYSIFLFLSIKS